MGGAYPATLPPAPPAPVMMAPPPPQMMYMAPPPPVAAPSVVVIGGGGMKMDPMCEGSCMAVGEIAESIGMDECLACCSHASLCIFAGPACADCIHGCCLAQTFRQQTGYNTQENTCKTCCCHYVTDGKSCITCPVAGCLSCCFFPFSCLYIPIACFVPPCSCALTQELRLARKLMAQQSTVVVAGPGHQMM